MSLGHSPQVASTGLVLNLDAGNTRSLSGVSANLLTTPEDVTVAPWFTIGANVSRQSNSITAPDGTLTADTLVTSAFVSGDSIYQDLTGIRGTNPYILSIFVKPGTATSISFAAFYTGSSTEGFSINFNPVTGLITGGTGTVTSQSNGWYRISFAATGTIAANTAIRFQVYLNNTGSVYLYGSQLELGSTLTPYYPVSRPTTTTWNDLSGSGNNATLLPNALSSVEVLVVAAGGGGGPDVGGGGGGGGVVYNPSFSVTSGTSYTVTVGTGGTAGSGPTPSIILGGNGGNSIFGTITAIGGGAGGSYASIIGAPGGSGGGSGGDSSGAFLFAGNGTVNQGFSGGIGTNNSVPYGAGGGGGAGGSGSNFTVAGGGNGGQGVGNTISGTLTYYGGGGGGGGGNDSQSDGRGYGGIGGGGTGSARSGPTSLIPGARDGTPNTGGGGGGTGGWNTAGAGGSGIVIVRYLGYQKATGGTVVYDGTYTTHTFTSVGSTTFQPATSVTPVYTTLKGGALTFNGSTHHLTTPNSTSLCVTNDLTINVWMYTTGATSIGLGLVAKAPESGDYDYMLYLTSSSTVISFYKKNSAGVGEQSVGYSYTFIGNWVNVCYTVAGTTCVGYINGIVVDTKTFTNAGIRVTNNPLRIGHAWSNVYYTGYLPVVQIYNRALSATEVTQNFNALKGRYGL